MHATDSIVVQVQALLVDNSHMVEVWENKQTKERWYIPYYSRSGRSWQRYLSNGQPVQFSSYGDGAIKAHQRAVSHINRSIRQQGVHNGSRTD